MSLKQMKQRISHMHQHKSYKKNHMETTELRKAVTATINLLEGLNSRMNKTEENISDLEDRATERDTCDTTTRDLEVLSLAF